MKIIKHKLADLPGVYVVNTIGLEDKIYLVGASENRGESCLLFTEENRWNQTLMWNVKTGIMNVIQIPNTKKILSITEFYPIFQSEHAGVDLCTYNNTPLETWNIERIIDLPYVHRIGIIHNDGIPYLLLSTLCKIKKFQEDWSSSGSVYICKIPNNEEKWELHLLHEGFMKNHGLFILEDNKAFISSETGVVLFDFSSSTPVKNVSPQIISNTPTSEVFIDDIDGDGILEMGAIEPFHGNTLSLYKYINNKLELMFQDQIDFGHVIWIGKIGGLPSIICGNRGGERNLLLYQYDENLKSSWGKKIIDYGVGATQINVKQKGNKTLILSSNHGLGEVCLYTIEN